MSNKIRLQDVFVLQRPGVYMDNDPDYPTLPHDVDIYHYTGENLRETVTDWADQSGLFVHRIGDVMVGDLEIHVPESSTSEGNPNLLLQGRRGTGGAQYAKITFKNATTGTNIAISAFDGTSRLQIGTSVSVYNTGIVEFVKDSASQLVSVQGNGALSLKNSTGKIADRLQWGYDGGTLYSGNAGGSFDVIFKRLEWDKQEGRLMNGDDTLLTWDADGAYYKGDITEDEHIVTLEKLVDYVGDYLPLAGNNSAPINGKIGPITGTVHFAGSGASSLSGNMGAPLVLEYQEVEFMRIGGTDDTVSFSKTIDVANNIIDNVRMPDDTIGAVHDEDAHAVPKEYVDKRIEAVLNQIQAPQQTPPGMINAYVGNTDPDGWLICDGRDLEPIENAKGYTFTQLRAALHLPASGSASLPSLENHFLGQVGTAPSSEIPSDGIRTKMGSRTKKPFAAGNDPIETEAVSDHNHGSVTMDAKGSHSHSVTITTKAQKQANSDNGNTGGAELTDPNRNSRNTMGPVNISSSTTAVSAHTHDITVPDDGGHTHTIDDSKWDRVNRPRTYGIRWIIRHD